MYRIVLTALFLSACAPIEVSEISATFDPDEVSFINASGSARITGQAFLRQNGGGVVTCAGSPVNLVPAGEYAVERLTTLYGSPQGGYASIFSPIRLDETSSEAQAYFAASRETVCDAQGNFSFSNLASGDYFVTTRVTWNVGGTPQGGVLSQRFQVQSGQSLELILTPQ